MSFIPLHFHFFRSIQYGSRYCQSKFRISVIFVWICLVSSQLSFWTEHVLYLYISIIPLQLPIDRYRTYVRISVRYSHCDSSISDHAETCCEHCTRMHRDPQFNSHSYLQTMHVKKLSHLFVISSCAFARDTHVVMNWSLNFPAIFIYFKLSLPTYMSFLLVLTFFTHIQFCKLRS